MNVEFLSLPVTRIDPSHGTRCFQIAFEPFHFKIDGQLFEVPIGFWTDWASVGFAASIISPIDHAICRAALGHDFLYFIGYESQAICDLFISRGMKVDGAAWWQWAVVWLGLTFGGKRTWDKYRRENKKHLQVSHIHDLAGGETVLKTTAGEWEQ